MGYDLPITELLKNRVIRFDPAKSEKLKSDRGVSLEHISAYLKKGDILSIEKHSSAKYPHQYLCEIVVKEYVYVVPLVLTPDEIFLKTAYPSRKATKKHRKGTIA